MESKNPLDLRTGSYSIRPNRVTKGIGEFFEKNSLELGFIMLWLGISWVAYNVEGPKSIFGSLIGEFPSGLSPTQVLFYLALALFPIYFWIRTHSQKAVWQYSVWWLWGVVVLLALRRTLVTFVLQNVPILYIDLLTLLAAWTVVVLIFYVARGDDGERYRTFVRQRRAIWITFLITALVAFAIHNYNFIFISQRIDGLTAPRRVLIAQVQTADTALSRVLENSSRLRDEIAAQLQSPAATPSGSGAQAAEANSPTTPAANAFSGSVCAAAKLALAEATVQVTGDTYEAPGVGTAREQLGLSLEERRSRLHAYTDQICANLAAARDAIKGAMENLPSVLAQEEQFYKDLDAAWEAASQTQSAPKTDNGSVPPIVPGTENGAQPTTDEEAEDKAQTEGEEGTENNTQSQTQSGNANGSSSDSSIKGELLLQEFYRKGVSLASTSASFTETDKATTNLADRFAPLWQRFYALDVSSSAPTAELSELGRHMTSDFVPRAERARNAAALTLAGVTGVELIVLPLVIGSSVLNVLFVMLPWFLLLLFIFRKRENLATGIVKDLMQLDPSRSLLKRVLDLTKVDVEAKKDPPNNTHPYSYDDPLSETDFPPDPPTKPTGKGASDSNSDPQKIEKQERLLKSVMHLPNIVGQGIKATSIQIGLKAFNIVRDELSSRVFSDFEYVLTLTWLSAILAIGWFFVFYPHDTSGLSVLIVAQPSVLGFARYLHEGLTPITTGFLGAYFWVTYVLLRRYFYGDLYPAAFLQAILRFTIVFIFSLFLVAIAPFIGTTDQVLDRSNLIPIEDVREPALLLIAFMVGIFPDEWLRYLTELANRITKNVFPLSFKGAPLVKLDGVSRFVETRLLEENVENVQSLATAHLQDLVVNTFFTGSQIVDWVDQAILYIHCGDDGKWFPLFRNAGVRNATDLLDRLGYKLSDGPVKQEQETEPDLDLLTQLTETIRSANKGTGTLPDTPWGKVHAAVVAFGEGLVKLSSSAEQAERLGKRIPTELPDSDETAESAANLKDLAADVTIWAKDARSFLLNAAQVLTSLEAWGLSADKLDPLKESVKAAQTTSQELRDLTDALEKQVGKINLTDAETLKEGTEWRGTLKAAVTKANELSNNGTVANKQILAEFPKPDLPGDVIATIYDVILPDPNMKYVLNWYAWGKQEGGAAA